MIVPQEIYHPLYEDKEKFIILIINGNIIKIVLYIFELQQYTKQ